MNPFAIATMFLAAASAHPGDLSALSDDFDGKRIDPAWNVFHQKYGWPSKIKASDVGVSTRGVLHLEPYHSAWVRDINGPFLFKTVRGDFDVRARIRAKGSKSPMPGSTWSLGGLMARTPNGQDAAHWTPRNENWQFITTGIGHVPGQQMTETKATFNGYSSLKLRPMETGWVELRLVKIGMAMFALARRDEKSRWEIRDRFYRMGPDLETQVGLIAYTTSQDAPQGRENASEANRTVLKDARIDMVLEVDWIRFSRPRLEVPSDWYTQVTANPLSDPNLSESEILSQLGE